MGCAVQGAILSPLRVSNTQKDIFFLKLKRIQAGIAKLARDVCLHDYLFGEHFLTIIWGQEIVSSLSLLPLSLPFCTLIGSFSLCKGIKLNRGIPSLSPITIYFTNGNDESHRGCIFCATGLCICSFPQHIIIFSCGHKAMLLKVSPGDDQPGCWVR